MDHLYVFPHCIHVSPLWLSPYFFVPSDSTINIFLQVYPFSLLCTCQNQHTLALLLYFQAFQNELFPWYTHSWSYPISLPQVKTSISHLSHFKICFLLLSQCHCFQSGLICDNCSWRRKNLSLTKILCFGQTIVNSVVTVVDACLFLLKHVLASSIQKPIYPCLHSACRINFPSYT